MSKLYRLLSGTLITGAFLIGFTYQPYALAATNNAKVINPTKDDYRKSINEFKRVLGKKLYQQYLPINRNLNGQNLYHYLITTSNKIDYPYYNKYAKIRQFYGNRHKLYVTNSITTRSDVMSAPLKTNATGQSMNQQLYDGRTIYYHMNATGDAEQLYNAGINAWNSLGVIKLVPTNDNGKNVIQFEGTQDNLDNGQADGLTTSSYYLSNNKLCDVTIAIDTEVLSEDSYRQLTVVEHEIGHALGLAHDNRVNDAVTSLMNGLAEDQTTGQNYSTDNAKQNLVGAKEQHVLMRIYNLTVMPGYYEYQELMK